MFNIWFKSQRDGEWDFNENETCLESWLETLRDWNYQFFIEWL